MAKTQKKSVREQNSPYPPVIAVLGHVDHGKTSLLDAIRKTNIVAREHGGITQKIGASSVEIIHDKIKRRLTFIDTPGHETFSKMRSRGAQVADIGLLIVSVTDGVMPQTKESIKLIKDAAIPYIVVLTKSDLPDKNPEKVKQQLIKEEVMLEGYGGDVPVIEVSAKANKNITELLELILLVFDMRGSIEEKKENASFKGAVIESKMDVRVGPKVTVVVKNGTISLRDKVTAEEVSGRIRTIINDQGKQTQKATIGDAVEILGFEKVPPVGSIVEKAGSVVRSATPVRQANSASAEASVPQFFDKPALSVVLCTDTVGSLEAILNSFPKEIYILSQKTGEVSEADILLAKSTGAIVLSFNTKLRPDVLRLASTEKVLLKNYTIIYELLDEVKDVLAGKQLALEEKIFGKAKILAEFPFEKTKVLGVGVTEGRIAKGDKVRIERDKITVGESTIASVRQGKNPISKVEKGQEAGIVLSHLLDFTIGDMLICHG